MIRQSQVSDAEKALITRLVRALEEFRKLDPEMPIQTILTYLYAAHTQGMNMTQIMKEAELSMSSASRNLQALSDLNRQRQPGHDLIFYGNDPAVSRREKIINLTVKGRGLLSRVIKAAYGGIA